MSLAYVHSMAWNGVGRTLYTCNNASELESSAGFPLDLFQLACISCGFLHGHSWV